MGWEKELEKELRKIKRAFWKIFVNSREFRSFKRKLKELNLEADIFLAMFIFGKGRASVATSRQAQIKRRDRIPPRLSREDREFLKLHGIRWD